MNITIRKATAADILLVKPLMIELQENEHELYSDRAEALEIADKYNEIIHRDVAAGLWHAYVAESDGNIVGFVAGTANNPDDDVFNVTRGFCVGDLVVAKKYRNLGIGSKLLAAIGEYAKQQGFESIELHTLAANLNAQRFYKSQGYGDFEVVLRKRL